MTLLAPAPTRRPLRRWWIEAAGRVWGPYPQGRMEGFVAEGRLTASSLVSEAPEGPFAPAALEETLCALFVPGAAAAAAREAAPSARPEPVGVSRPLLVFAALKSTRADLFEATVAAQGECVRVAPGLWLVRARCAAAPLRNLLSRRLREGDVLVVTEVELAQAAWFALPGDTDRALRRLLSERRE